jgi:hypothetical protein
MMQIVEFEWLGANWLGKRAGKRLPVGLRQFGTTGNIPLHRDPKSVA